MKISPALTFVCIVATAMADESSPGELLHGQVEDTLGRFLSSKGGKGSKSSRLLTAGLQDQAVSEGAEAEVEVEGAPGRFLGKGGKGSKGYRLLTGLQDQAVSEGAEVEAEPEVEVEGTPGRFLSKGGKGKPAGKAARRLGSKSSKGTKRL